MKKEKSNIFDKIVESYLEYTNKDEYETAASAGWFPEN